VEGFVGEVFGVKEEGRFCGRKCQQYARKTCYGDMFFSLFYHALNRYRRNVETVFFDHDFSIAPLYMVKTLAQ